jgi:hypothetical protein
MRQLVASVSTTATSQTIVAKPICFYNATKRRQATTDSLFSSNQWSSGSSNVTLTSCSLNFTALTSTQNKNDRHDHMPRAAFICICVSRLSSAISSLLPYATMTHSHIPRPIAAATQMSCNAFQKHNNQQHLVSVNCPVTTRRQPTLSLVDLVDTLYQRLSLVDLVDTLYQQRHPVLHTYFTLTTTINCLVFMTLSSATTIATTLCVA